LIVFWHDLPLGIAAWLHDSGKIACAKSQTLWILWGQSATITAMSNQSDFIVIGAGIAGVSVAAHLAEQATVTILEMEERPAYHTTGRSAATFEPNYGPKPILAVTRASASFFNAPPAGFADGALISPRGSLVLEPHDQAEAAAKFMASAVGVVEMGPAELEKLFPVLRPAYATRGFYEAATGDLDVDLIFGGFLRQFKARGGRLVVSAPAQTISRTGKLWTVTTPQGQFTAPALINAAGAWGDEIAKRAGVKPIGLTPKRRSIGVIPVQGHAGFMAWPMVTDCGETWYAKPQSGKMIVSSADVTPVEPHDAYADDMAIAVGVERLMEATTIEVTRLEHSWGGLRTFAPDGSPVVGFDPSTDGFFWLVGQGGYGIQSSPALSRTAAALALRQNVPDDILAHDLVLSEISPNRLR
jgi:D-arginine dehydrogenase